MVRSRARAAAGLARAHGERRGGSQHGGSHLVREFEQSVRGERGGLVNERDRATLQGGHGDVAAVLGHRDHDHAGKRLDRELRELTQKADPVEMRHDEVKRQDVGGELHDLLESVEAVARRPDDQKAGVRLEHFADHFAREGGVVDDENANLGKPHLALFR